MTKESRKRNREAKHNKIRWKRLQEIQRRDRKIVLNCIMCGKKLSKNSPHHNKCHTCWCKYMKKLKERNKILGRG